MQTRYVTIEARANIPSNQLYVEYYPRIDKSSEASFTSESTVPVIICLPGGPGGSSSLYRDYQLTQFCQWADVILMDPRGCGDSLACSDVEYHMDVYVDDVEAIRQQFKLSQWIVLGTSYGSTVAQAYALRYPEALQGLILVNGSPSSDFIRLAENNLKRWGSQTQADWFARLLAGELRTEAQMAEYFKIMWPLYSVKAASDDWARDKAGKVSQRYSAQAAVAGFGPGGFLRDFDWLPYLSAVTCPCLMVVGEKDWITPPQLLEQEHQVMPQSQLQVLPDCAHMIWLDQPGQYFAYIKTYIRELTQQ